MLREATLTQVHKDLRDSFKIALARGWKVLHRTNGHLVWKNPDGRVATTPGTNIGGRNLQNALAQLRRAGIAEIVATVAKPAAAPESAVEESEVTATNGATTSLAEALREAAEAAEAKRLAEQTIAKLTVIDAIMEVAKANPERTFDIEWMVFKITGRTLGAASAGSVSNALTRLTRDGRIRRVGHGAYKLAVYKVAGSPAAPQPAPTIAPVEETSVDSDMAALNTLLDAMANAEGAIRRLLADREKIAKVRELLK